MLGGIFRVVIYSGQTVKSEFHFKSLRRLVYLCPTEDTSSSGLLVAITLTLWSCLTVHLSVICTDLREGKLGHFRFMKLVVFPHSDPESCESDLPRRLLA